MLVLTIPEREWFDEEKEEFRHSEGGILKLEHSLVSISKWEEKWEKPFLDPRMESAGKTREETVDYARCMSLDETTDPELFDKLTIENIQEINAYIGAKHTATWFSEYAQKIGGGRSNRIEIITSEVIYGWMVQYRIPAEYQTWHLNRLLTLIRVLNHMNNEQPKMSKNELLKRNASLNAERRKRLNSKG